MPRHRRGWAVSHHAGKQDRHSPLAVSLLEPVLLVLLKEHPRHGYHILSEIGAMGMSTIHPSVVYRTLRELERMEWIRSDWDTNQTQGPPRRIYELTAQGEMALQNWQIELDKSRKIIRDLLERSEYKERG
jgi:PadR family transcriptional regulator PadR